MNFLPFLVHALLFLIIRSYQNGKALQDVQESLPPQFLEACGDDAQIQPEFGEPDARRYPSVTCRASTRSRSPDEGMQTFE
ncbi:MAG: hypothetical protein [Microvirus sp.]|nr:MAG: hypothetical protein [Microvirus sp.]